MDDSENNSFFRVLSIQSHVVSGYVGNKSACFPLQVLGFEVDFINSVQLSNHTDTHSTSEGYKHIKGERLDSKHLEEIYDGLKLNGLTSYTHILTGYVGTLTFLNKLVDIVKELKKMDPSIFFVCDPVMGDNNEMYVPEELLPIYRDHLIPLSNLITPNQFETELLTGISIKSKEDALEAMNVFHSRGVEHVILSSVDINSTNELILFGSSMQGKTKSIFSMKIPKLPSVFTGTGDLFSALLLAWMARTGGNLKDSCEKTVNTLQSVLLRTLEYASGTKDPASPHSLELKLIQSKKVIENPPDKLKCEILEIH